MKNNKVRAIYAAAIMLGVSAISLQATPTPLESAVEQVETTATAIVGQSTEILTAALGLFAIAFGVRWLVRLFKGSTK